MCFWHVCLGYWGSQVNKKYMGVLAFLHIVNKHVADLLLRDCIKSHLNMTPPLVQENLSSSVTHVILAVDSALHSACCSCPHFPSEKIPLGIIPIFFFPSSCLKHRFSVFFKLLSFL